jgi:two-component system LytT family response regulator
MATQSKLRVAIVDDESHARSRLRQLLKVQPDLEIVAECSNGQQAVETISSQAPDVVFLDIQMPRLNGLQVCETLAASGKPLPILVFVTAYDQFALKAFDVHAVDYLLKPFDQERFGKCLDQVRRQAAYRAQAQTKTPSGSTAPDPVDPVHGLQALLETLRERSRYPDRLVFKQNGKVIFLRPDGIDFVEADGNYVKLHAGRELHHLRETMTSIEAQLAPEKFIRISRSTIVNLDRIKELQPLFYGDYVVILHDGAKLNLTRNYRDRIEALLGQ